MLALAAMGDEQVTRDPTFIFPQVAHLLEISTVYTWFDLINRN